ncbi:unnamed protein product [Owenia fusiformis]|uniref:Uncharacterized protein n=1 Tax=Owenia fusiformis TaxID=6347 RepID=A0A8J1T626_OWEFU|nr:unnamed protein product [Owenia fusiformis]
MSDIQKLPLEDALADSPQTRKLAEVFQKDATMLKGYTGGLQKIGQRLLAAQNEMTAATQQLSNHLKSYELQRFPLEESDDSIVGSTLSQFTSYLDELSSMHQVMATQFADGMMFPLNKFLQADLEEIANMSGMFQIASQEMESSYHKYMKLPKKRDSERIRHEANNELCAMRKKFHQTALHYYSSLNNLQYKRKYAFIEPLLGYMHAQKAFLQMGSEYFLKTQDFDQFLGNIQASVNGVHSELSSETQKTVEFIQSIEQQSQHLYHGEPVGDAPYISNINISQKSGYLMIRKQAMLGNKWERMYFFTQGGNLMCQAVEEVAGSLILDLNEDGTYAAEGDGDDRRYVFVIHSPKVKKTVHLQAENQRERNEWIAAINNTVRSGGYVKDRSSSNSSNRSRSSSDSQPVKPGELLVSPSSAPPQVSQVGENDGYFFNTPIQFDMISPSDENRELTGSKEGPVKRINPFDQSTIAIVNDNVVDNAAFSKSFVVRFLGSMEVKYDRGDSLVNETIRQIMAARAIHNMFKTTESLLLVSSECMRLLDPSNKSVRAEFGLADISFWAAHRESKKLFGFITKLKGGSQNTPFSCFVFESDSFAEEVCHAISTATQLAFQALMSKSEGSGGAEGATNAQPEPKETSPKEGSEHQDTKLTEQDDEQAPPLPTKEPLPP